jgi:serine/threonine-protein kinase
MRQHATTPPILADGLPAWAREVIGRCLEKRPEDRYQTPRELVQALRFALDAPATGPALGGAAVAVDRTARPPGPATAAPLPTTMASPPQPPRRGPEQTGGSTAAPLAEAPAARGSRRRLALLALLPVVAIAAGIAALAIALGGRGDGGDTGPTPTAEGTTAAGLGTGQAGSPTRSPTASPAPSPTPTATPPLLAAGEQRSLANLAPMALAVDPEKCPGVEVVWRLQSISAEASGRVTVAYTVQVPRVSGVGDCLVSINPDKDCDCWALQTRLPTGRVSEAPISGGRGVAETGADDLYGRAPLSGAWIFDAVNLAGTELTLLFYLDDGVLAHRQPLLPS